MTSTDELRKLLDERGVEWRETMSGGTAWICENGDEAVTLREDAGLLQLRAWVTPEQAIAATLDDGEYEKDEPDGWYKCAECGCVVGYWLLADDSWTIYMEDYQIPFNNCPKCGMAVKR